MSAKRYELNDRVASFGGEWVENGADREGLRLALKALWEAVLRCPNELMLDDMNTTDALAFIEGRIAKPELIASFRRAFDCPMPELRFQQARLAYHQIFKCLGQMAHPLSSGL